MTVTDTRKQFPVPAAVWFVPAIMLLVALGDMPYGFYSLLRWVACAAFLCLAYQEHQLRGETSAWLIMFAILALLFNPVLPVHLTHEAWAPVDAGSAIALVIHYLVRERRAARNRDAAPPAPVRISVEPDPPSNALAGKSRLQQYEIVRVLGAGGFGITYLAFDHVRNGPVAIKEYFYAGLATRRSGGGVAPSAASKAEGFAWGLSRFLDEARLLATLSHPNIVRVHRCFEANDTAYIVMDYIEGESLEATLARHDRLTPAQWWPWMRQLLDGLEHAHGRDYLHRDVKPANIVVRAAGSQPVLIDFGAARRAAAEKTRQLTAVHTPGYAPIEQYSTSSRQGPSTDIYALAAVSYRVLMGKAPQDAAGRAVEDEYEPLAQRLERPGDRFLAAIDGALALRAKDRPQDIATWRAELAAAAPDGPTGRPGSP